MQYGTFLSRLGALIIDAILLLPVTVFSIWSGGVSKLVAMAMPPLCSALGIAYHIYFHGRFGQTPGKWLTRIRVTRIDGKRISWREARLRSSVDIILALVITIGAANVMLQLPEAHFSKSWVERSIDYVHAQPRWLRWTSNAATAWIWSEVIVMLLNRRRRALHDFIAGTVVVSDLNNQSNP